MRKMIICCLVLFLSGFNFKNSLASVEKNKTNQKKVVYVLSIKAIRDIPLDCNKKEDEEYINKLISGISYLQEFVQEKTKCSDALKIFKNKNLKFFTQQHQVGEFSLIQSMSGPLSIPNSEFQVFIDARGLEIALQTFTKENGWKDHHVYTRIISNEELRDALGSDCFFCKKDENK